MTEHTAPSIFTTSFGEEIWRKKYAGSYSDPVEYYQDMARRVSLGDKRAEEKFLRLLLEQRFSPGGRILAWNGRTEASSSLINCTTHTIEDDSLDAIADTAHVLMKASSRGQGIGMSLSNLRPMESPVNNAAKTSTGAISFMEMLNTVGGTIGQNGRRAALLFSIRDSHPDLWRGDVVDIPCAKCNGKGCFACRGKGGYAFDFLSIKRIPGRVENANISVEISDAFMQAVNDDADWALYFDGVSGGESFHVERTVRAKDLFRALAFGAWASAEPGVLFTDTSRRMSNSDLFGYNIVGVNACVRGDTLIQTEDGEITIAALSDMDNPPRILTINEDTGELEYDTAVWIKMTRSNADVVQLILNDGTKLVLTHDHLVRSESRGWIRADQLVKGEPVLVVQGDKMCTARLDFRVEVGTTDVYDIGMWTNHNFTANGIIVHNCSEQWLDQDGVCNLGSMNLAKYVTDPFTANAQFDRKAFMLDVQTAVHFLDNVLEIELLDGRSITNQQRQSIKALRRIGLGVMGLADMLAMMGLRYEANGDTLKFIDTVFRAMRDAAYDKSIQLAKAKGPCDVWKRAGAQKRKEAVDSAFYDTLSPYHKREIIKHGLRNGVLLSVAPTGSISNLYGVSGGLEPVYALSYTRRVRMNGKDEFVEVVHPGVQMSRAAGLPDSVWQTSYDVSPKDHVAIQAAVQSFVDAACSKTVNMPNDATVEDVENIYMLAWQMGLKGVAIYRDGSRDIQILSASDRANGEADDTNACPSCGEQMIKQEGCSTCPSCGHSKCG